MTITVELPDDLLQRNNPARLAIEAIAIAGYRSGTLSTHAMRILLGFETRYELDGFLKTYEIFERAYGLNEYEQDVASIKSIEISELQKQ